MLNNVPNSHVATVTFLKFGVDWTKSLQRCWSAHLKLYTRVGQTAALWVAFRKIIYLFFIFYFYYKV